MARMQMMDGMNYHALADLPTPSRTVRVNKACWLTQRPPAARLTAVCAVFRQFFGYLSMVLYGIDAFLMFHAWRTGQTAAAQQTAEQVTTPAY